MKTRYINYFSWISERTLCRIPRQAIKECSHSGPCDSDVARWLPEVKDWADDATLRDELQPYGAWNDLDTATTETLRERVLWLGCGNILEDQKLYGVRL